MRISCPFCGDRDLQEFVYRGDASAAGIGDCSDMVERVYLRDNPAGPIDEHWYHAQGCRRWLVVTRDTRTHAIGTARLAREPKP
jgi:sarcosine oxidase subunit delta